MIPTSQLKLQKKVLYNVAKPIIKFDAKLKLLTRKMEKLMVNEGGIGLAAPQIGISKRVFIIRINNSCQAFINPTLLTKDGPKSFSVEGCLSFPGEEYAIERYESILVEYQDLDGGSHHQTYTGLIARCFQHELDHLDGITINQR
jgi:peptide deformylase